jgi:hypothetical protein
MASCHRRGKPITGQELRKRRQVYVGESFWTLYAKRRQGSHRRHFGMNRLRRLRWAFERERTRFVSLHKVKLGRESSSGYIRDSSIEVQSQAASPICLPPLDYLPSRTMSAGPQTPCPTLLCRSAGPDSLDPSKAPNFASGQQESSELEDRDPQVIEVLLPSEVAAVADDHLVPQKAQTDHCCRT